MVDRARVMERIKEAIEFDTNGGCWLWTRKTVAGMYGSFKISGRHWLVHRASWAAVNGPIPDGLIVRHKCDVTFCVNPSHLEVGTLRDNSRDRSERGRWKGPSVGRRNLTSADVEFIRDRLSEGWKDHRIAHEIGVATNTVGRRRRKMLNNSKTQPQEPA